VPVAARELQAGFHGLGSAVAEEHPREAGQRREPPRHLALQRMEVQIGCVGERRGLVGKGARERRIGMPERRHADAGHEVQELPALVVIKTRAAAADEHDRRAAVDLQHVRRFERLYLR
jgi:hypothetical protein